MRRKIGSNQDLPIHCKYDKLVSTFSLEPNPDNPNVHSNEQIKLLSKIITKNGWRDKIVVSNQSGMIVRGHGRFEAAKLLKLGKVPVEYQDYETYADEVRDLVADNKISEFSHIDKDQMLKLFDSVKDFSAEDELSELGFTEDELSSMFKSVSEDSMFDGMGEFESSSNGYAIIKVGVPGGVWFDSKEKIIDSLDTFCTQYGLTLEVPKEPQRIKKARGSKGAG